MKWNPQWLIIPLLALVVSNILIKGPLPFSEGYHFPVRYFLAFTFAIFCICESNNVVFRYLDKRLPFEQDMGKRIAWQAMGSFGATLITFIPVYFIKTWWIGEEVSPRSFLFYGFVAFSISIALNCIRVIGYLARVAALKKAVPGPMAVGTGNRTLMLDLDKICWWYSSAGTVTVVKADGVRFTTNYTSFATLGDRLPPGDFFHLNRQVIANRRSIDSVQNGQNGQLTVLLKTGEPSGETLRVTISRYKRDAFRTWLDG